MRTLKHDEVNLVGGGSVYVIEPASETYSTDGFAQTALRWVTSLVLWAGNGGSMPTMTNASGGTRG